MTVAVFLSVASIVAIVTIGIGLALTGSPNWHFTLLDVVTDVGDGLAFGLVSHVLSTYWIQGRPRLHAVIAVLLAIAGILTAFTTEGGAAKALIFGA